MFHCPESTAPAQGSHDSLFQLTEFQFTEFQFTEFQLTLFQLTEFQFTLPHVIG